VCPHLGQNRLDRVERPGIELAGLDDDDCRSIRAGHCARECRGQQPALGIGRDADHAVMP